MAATPLIVAYFSYKILQIGKITDYCLLKPEININLQMSLLVKI